MTTEEELIRARAAQAILQEPVLKQAFEDLESHYTEVWKRSRPTERDKREEAHSALFALSQFRQQLRNYLETGILAKAASSKPEE